MTERFTVDAQRSSIRLRTRAKGLLARLAHDLQIHARDVTGEATRDSDRWTAELRVTIDGLRVEGVVRSGVVHPDVLSEADRREIERKIREEVFSRAPAIVVTASGTPSDAHVRILFGERSATLTPRLTVVTQPDAIRIEIRNCTVSMRALGLAEVKGPLGAFHVKDDVELEGELIYDLA